MPDGIVYLLHFDTRGPGGAQHYLGFTEDLEARLAAHRSGRGARLTSAIRRLGISFKVVQVWTPATKADERKLKNRHQAARLCPICRPLALRRHAEVERKRRKTVHAK